MTLQMYAIKDEHNGFTPPIPFTKDEIAKRYFNEMLNENITMKYAPKDFSIWQVGEYDSDTGNYKDLEHNRLIERG